MRTLEATHIWDGSRSKHGIVVCIIVGSVIKRREVRLVNIIELGSNKLGRNVAG